MKTNFRQILGLLFVAVMSFISSSIQKLMAQEMPNCETTYQLDANQLGYSPTILGDNVLTVNTNTTLKNQYNMIFTVEAGWWIQGEYATQKTNSVKKAAIDGTNIPLSDFLTFANIKPSWFVEMSQGVYALRDESSGKIKITEGVTEIASTSTVISNVSQLVANANVAVFEYLAGGKKVLGILNKDNGFVQKNRPMYIASLTLFNDSALVAGNHPALGVGIFKNSIEKIDDLDSYQTITLIPNAGYLYLASNHIMWASTYNVDNLDKVNIYESCPTYTLPTITTTTATAITPTTATLSAEVLTDGGAAVTERGFCYSLSPNPTTADSKTSDGSGIGVFSSSVSGLTPGTTYYVRAYASNSVGTSYGEEMSFTTVAVYNVNFDVKDQANQTIADAVLTFAGQTYAAGVYTVANTEPGTYSYSVAKNGYNTQSGELVVSNADVNKAITLELTTYLVKCTVKHGSTSLEAANIEIGGKNILTNAAGYAEVALVPGTYTYTVSKTNYQSISGTTTVSNADVVLTIAIIAVGLEDAGAGTGAGVVLYPNPMRHELHILGIQTNTQISITDMQGRTLALPMVSTGTAMKINTQDLPEGVYFIHMVHDGQRATYRVVK